MMLPQQTSDRNWRRRECFRFWFARACWKRHAHMLSRRVGWMRRKRIFFINVAYKLDGNLAKLQQRVAMTTTTGMMEFGRISGDELITVWAGKNSRASLVTERFVLMKTQIHIASLGLRKGKKRKSQKISSHHAALLGIQHRQLADWRHNSSCVPPSSLNFQWQALWIDEILGGLLTRIFSFIGTTRSCARF